MYVPPHEVLEQATQVGEKKASLPIKDMVVRGFLSASLLGYATALAIYAAAQTKSPLVGALIFPVGFVILSLLGLELVTGNFAILLLPLF
jgi:formate/nitrite transporter FocA (FNT family)